MVRALVGVLVVVFGFLGSGVSVPAIELMAVPAMEPMDGDAGVPRGMAGGSVKPGDEAGAELFRERIEPVLAAECYRCHAAGAKKLGGGLRLDSRAAMLRGGDSGPAVVPGNAAESLMLQAIRHEDGLRMPPQKPKLPESFLADVKAWIETGAPDPRDDGSVEATAPADDPLAEARAHWAFQPVRAVAIPQVEGGAEVDQPVDAFVLRSLRQQGWSFAPPASRAEWIRRVTFDLVGLPPTPEEVDAFVNDPAPDAEARLVERLLASPRYGERWGQHWLDVVRYAETEGYEYDRTVPGAWRFRDYVIESLNRDKPFDRFLTEQIAGDEIAPEDPECQTASIFHRLGPVRRNAGNPEIALSRNEVLTERTDILGSAVLGLTIGCARCHNHKLEPITQRDYYRLQAYLAATEENNIVLGSAAELQAWEAKRKSLQEEMARLREQLPRAAKEERKELAKRLEMLEDVLADAPPTIPATCDDPHRRTPIHVLRRGVWEQKGEPVGPRPPSVLVAADEPELPAEVADPRTRLARWLVASDNPLTARVVVNRVWAYHFGTGLVKTVNDFGTRGDRPSHPELLDWLTHWFVEGGWRLKPLHRLILLSRTYRQSGVSEFTSQAARIDPENRLLWRFPRRRLTAEELRDAILAVSGRLNSQMRGASVMVPVDRELVDLLYKPSQWQVTPDPRAHDRRTIYLMAKRNLRLPFLEVFDAPTLQSSCPRRESSTHAPQALELLNGSLVNELSRAFARRLQDEVGDNLERVVDRAYRLALGRPPTPAERTHSVEFLREQPLEDFALALFNLNGFLYVW